MDGGPSENVQHLYLYGSVTTRFYKMYKKFDIWCVKNMDPIDLIDHPWNMEIGLYLCWKETNNKQTLRATNHLIEDLETLNCMNFYDIYCILIFYSSGHSNLLARCQWADPLH
jgi:hypothetical protein